MQQSPLVRQKSTRRDKDYVRNAAAAHDSPPPSVPQLPKNPSYGGLGGGGGSNNSSRVAGEGVPDGGLAPPSKSGARKGGGKTRRKSWGSRFGSGNWMSLVTGTEKGAAPQGPNSPARGGGDSMMSPSSARGGGVKQSRSGGAAPWKVDLDMFVADDFRPDDFVHATLNTNSEEGVRSFQQMLEDAKGAATQDLKSNVFQHYNEFVVISKEISKLESDMLYLSGLMNDLKGVQLALVDENTVEDSASTKMQSRETFYLALDDSKKLDEALNKQAASPAKGESGSDGAPQMSAVYELVENVSKRLPYDKARVFIREGSMVELDSKSFKYSRSVSIFLFNDYILTAVRKKRVMLSKHRYVAEHAWPIGDVAVMDIKSDIPDAASVFRLHTAGHTYVFRCESAREKRVWISVIRKACDHWRYEGANGATMGRRQLSVGDVEDTYAAIGEADGGVSTSGNLAGSPRDGASQSLGGGLAGSDRPGGSVGISDSGYRLLMDQMDELDVHTAHREFDAAVSVIESIRETINIPPPHSSALKTRLYSLRRDLDDRVQKLAAVISHDLQNPHLSRNQIKLDLRRLQRLSLQDQARDIFLQARGKIIKQRIRLLKFAGDIVQYINELALVTFTLIKNTCEWYKSVFKDPQMASAFVVWAQTQLELYCKTFVKQVYAESNQTFTTIIECIRCTEEQCSLLKEVGLDMAFLFSQMCAENMVKAIGQHEQRCAEVLVRSIIEDPYMAISGSSTSQDPPARSPDAQSADDIGSSLPVSKSTVKFYHTIVDFLNETSILLQPSLQKNVFLSVGSLFDAFLNWQLQVLNEKELNVEQYHLVLNNAAYLLEEFYPRIVRQMTRRSEQPLPEADTLSAKFRDTQQAMAESLGKRRGQLLLRDMFKFASTDYSNNTPMEDDAVPSDGIRNSIAAISDLAGRLPDSVDKHKVGSAAIGRFITGIMEPDTWSPTEEPRVFGVGGATQFVLDIHFLLKVCKECVNPTTGEVAQEICERALKSYFSAYGTTSGGLKSGDWYEKRVNAALRTLGPAFTEFGARFPRKSPAPSRRSSGHSSSDRHTGGSRSRLSPTGSASSVHKSHESLATSGSRSESMRSRALSSPTSAASVGGSAGQLHRSPTSSSTRSIQSRTHASTAGLADLPLPTALPPTSAPKPASGGTPAQSVNDLNATRGPSGSKVAQSVPNLSRVDGRDAARSSHDDVVAPAPESRFKSERHLAPTTTSSPPAASAPVMERRGSNTDARRPVAASAATLTTNSAAAPANVGRGSTSALPAATSASSVGAMPPQQQQQQQSTTSSQVSSRVAEMQARFGQTSASTASLNASPTRPPRDYARRMPAAAAVAASPTAEEETTAKSSSSGERLQEKLAKLEKLSQGSARTRNWEPGN
ncbi:exocyst complex component exo84 [Sorochytrium milnesiophthora]